MSIARRSRHRNEVNVWPAFVDALGQLVIAIVFLLLIFTVAQFLTTDALSGRERALKELTRQVNALTETLSLEKSSNEKLQSRLASLSQENQVTMAEKDQLNQQLAEEQGRSQSAADQAAALAAQLESEKAAGQQGQDQITDLNQQIAALRRQLQEIAAALDLAQSKNVDQQNQIADLGTRLNTALASKVEELARYRSEFFGKIKEVLGDRPDIRIVGDRFVFQSEVLFAPASAELGDGAKTQLMPVAAALRELLPKIPRDINWVLRVDGHTDRRPIATAQFPSNWELSTERAISVVRFLVDQGIPPGRLAAAGFGEFQPLEQGSDEAAYQRNRRIELKLTER